ncbi:hemolysin D [Tistrella bauzanensis]|uniref:Hemolysin D n=1 Tax=Tistrella bauzanensis TaxID=657419 RepID=A0ABQ1IAL6_9PROT|nr:efflux RND transporter periplasmic adaptor subunit [Tistrella bauzanensis]GGB25447.1 hemolysin D [Tistrella bauzanensis]
MNRSILLALILAAALGAWMYTGRIEYGFDADAASTADATAAPEAGGDTGADPATSPPAEAGPFTVRTARLSQASQVRDLVVSGHTEMRRVVDLSAESAGRIIELPVAQGVRVEAGDVIARLDRRDLEARSARAKALVDQRRAELKAATALSAKGFQTELRLAEARAQFEAARAERAEIEQDLADSTLNAPFAGFIDRRHVEIGAYVSPGSQIARLLAPEPYLIVAEIAERDIGSLTRGQTARARLADGTEVSGTLAHISRQADPQTRTFRIEIEVGNPDGTLPGGVTAELAIPLDKRPAVLLTPALLSLDARGRVGVKVVDGDDRVAFDVVSILSASDEGVWVTGLDEDARVIVVGQGYVATGERVAPVEVTPAELRGLVPLPREIEDALDAMEMSRAIPAAGMDARSDAEDRS